MSVHRNILAVAALAFVGWGASGCGRAHDRATTQRSGILFSGNWETGNISQWGGAQCANTGVPYDTYAQRGTINIVTDVVAQGRYAARFDLPASEEKPSACEALRGRTLNLNGDDWYALDVRFPSDWREPSRAFSGMSLAQFDYQGLAGAPVGLAAHGDHVNLVTEGGPCGPNRVGTNFCLDGTGNDLEGEGPLGHIMLRIVPVGTHLAGTWEQFIVHIHHAADSSGLVQGWWRPLGGTWTHTVQFSGYPTVQWKVGESPPTASKEVVGETVDKIGAYRGPSNFPISIWQDGFCDATSFSAAASCL